MRRLRITFLLLGILLLAPLSLLLWRAWQGIERERDARHELVASRVFDEAERALGELLREEQGRPADHYLSVSDTGEPSPLATTPPADFVLGYFEVDRSGTLSTPRVADRAALEAQIRDALPALTTGLGFRAEPARREKSSGRIRPRPEPKLVPKQAPGSTVTLQKVGPLKSAQQLEDKAFDEIKEEEAPAPPESSSLSSYELIERLNMAPRKRALAEASAAAESNPPSAPSLSASRPESRADARSADEVDRDSFADGPPPPADSEPVRPSAATPPSLAGSGARAQSEPAVSPPVALRTALAGLAAGGTRLVLHRTVLRDDEAVEQGFVVDLARLAAWLESEVLGASGLRPYLELDFPLAGVEQEPLPSGRFVYEHRFEEPFAALSARLSVALLPDEGSAAYLFALGTLLVLASTAGLWAVYRRVAAAVHFSERRSNFAAAVSHELKTPLTAIRMYAEMLRDGMVADESTRRSYLDTITSESERLTRLINNVLEFSRLERRSQELALVSETPLPALRAALRTLEPHALAQGFALREQSTDPLPAALHDRDALQQILFNLIDNALKYARRAERKEIEISCAPCTGGVAVRVRDFGPGVAREHQPHLFEPFYRGGAELTRQTQGTGIGLALVRELAQRMGAEVSAQNCADGGFAVELRLRSA